jgi:hypothetical protein
MGSLKLGMETVKMYWAKRLQCSVAVSTILYLKNSLIIHEENTKEMNV